MSEAESPSSSANSSSIVRSSFDMRTVIVSSRSIGAIAYYITFTSSRVKAADITPAPSLDARGDVPDIEGGGLTMAKCDKCDQPAIYFRRDKATGMHYGCAADGHTEGRFGEWKLMSALGGAMHDIEKTADNIVEDLGMRPKR